MTGLGEDIERLEGIAERVLSGEPIESFDLTYYERLFVLGYTGKAVDDAFASSRFGSPPGESGA